VNKRYYDVVILGDSLASQIAGALLVKGGCRVLTFRPPESRPAPLTLSPIPVSRPVEKLLDLLGGRNCVAQMPPYHVVTRESRFEIAGGNPLDDELSREFGADALLAAAQLKKLQHIGEKLELLILKNGGLPVSGAGNRLRFSRDTLLGGLLKGTGQSLERFFAPLPPSSRNALTVLFAGLTLTPGDRLSVAEAALLWTGILRGKAVATPDFVKLLSQRYEQFHGGDETLSTIRDVEYDKHKLTDLQLKKGRQCSGAWYLLGSPNGIRPIEKALASQNATPERTTYQLLTSTLDGPLSPMLCPVNLPESPFPVRFSLAHSHGSQIGVLDLRTGNDAAGTLPEHAELKRILDPLLPFGEYTFEPPLEEPNLPLRHHRGTRLFPNIRGDWRLLSNLLACHGASTAPVLGSTGEILTGMTLANALLKNLKKAPLF